MSLFWNKKIESSKVIYTRSKSQKRIGYLLLLIGLLLVFGVPTLIKISIFFTGLSNRWPILFLFLIFIGVAVIAFVAISISTVNFKLAAAKRKNKKFQITSTDEGDTVIIEN